MNLGKELRKPLESIGITHSSNDGAHVKLNWTDSTGSIGSLILSVGIHQSQGVLEFLLTGRGGHINFISEHQKGNVTQFFRRQEGVQFLLCLRETTPIDGIDEVDDAVDGGKVILPQSTSGFVTTEIESLEFNVANDEFVRVGMEGGDVDLHSVLLEHVEEGGLTGIVQSQK